MSQNISKKTKIHRWKTGSAPYISTQSIALWPTKLSVKGFISISISYESECAIIAALAVALFVCLGNSVKVQAVELPSSTVIPLHARVGPSARFANRRTPARSAIGSGHYCCQWPPTSKCDELASSRLLLLKRRSPVPTIISRCRWSRIACRPSGITGLIYYTQELPGPVGTGTFTLASSLGALGVASAFSVTQCTFGSVPALLEYAVRPLRPLTSVCVFVFECNSKMILSPDSSVHNVAQLPESTTQLTDMSMAGGHHHREPALNLGTDAFTSLRYINMNLARCCYFLHRYAMVCCVIARESSYFLLHFSVAPSARCSCRFFLLLQSSMVLPSFAVCAAIRHLVSIMESTPAKVAR